MALSNRSNSPSSRPETVDTAKMTTSRKTLSTARRGNPSSATSVRERGTSGHLQPLVELTLPLGHAGMQTDIGA